MTFPSTMQDRALTVRTIFDHGRAIHADSAVISHSPSGRRVASFADVAERAARLASGLAALGVRVGDRVATMSWNHQEHLEAYLAIPSMGAVLHTLNIRFSPEQLAYIISHAGDRVVIVDASLVDTLAAAVSTLCSVETFVVVGDGDASVLEQRAPVIKYEDVLRAGTGTFDWPDIDERAGASMCYTSGTTGAPKGVVYGHRSTFLHSLSHCTTNAFGIGERDRVLVMVPMFHANGWGFPYSAWLAGADLVFSGSDLSAPHVAGLIERERATFSGAVPTIWNDILRYGESHEIDLSSLRAVTSGGAPVPVALTRQLRDRYSVPMVQGWGMTECSPLCVAMHEPEHAADDGWMAKAGRVLCGVELRIVGEDGEPAPWDGMAKGEIEVRGPWITGSYYRDDAPEKFHDGWLRTGDIATVDAHGAIQIVDRTKDVIKSGGEWISSVELENLLMEHPDVLEAAVIAVPHERWQERPMACVVVRPGASADIDTLLSFLETRVPKWWMPDRWVLLDEIPKTSVGKFDKKVLRSEHGHL